MQDTVLGVFDPILETGGNFLGLEDDNNEIGKKFSKKYKLDLNYQKPIFATLKVVDYIWVFLIWRTSEK